MSSLDHNSLESLSSARGRKSQNDIYLHALSDLETQFVSNQEYIIERETILLHYGPVLQDFTGVMIFVMIFTGLWPES